MLIHRHILPHPARLVALIHLLLAASLFGQSPPVAEKAIADARGAVITVGVHYKETGLTRLYGGAFLNDQGWAVIPLESVAYHHPPLFKDAQQRELRFKKILAVDREVQLAIVELDYPDSPALKLTEELPKRWEEVALLWLSHTQQGTISGPILSHRLSADLGPGSPIFLNLGMRIKRGISPANTGSPVINGDGHLVGLFKSSVMDGPIHPSRIVAISGDPIRAILLKARDNRDGLPFPLEAAYPFDAAYWEYELSPTTAAREKNALLNNPAQQAKGESQRIQQLRTIAEKHPASAWAAEKLIESLMGDLMREVAQHGGKYPAKGEPINPEVEAKTNAVFAAAEKHGPAVKSHRIRTGVKAIGPMMAGDFQKLAVEVLEELERWGDSPPFEILTLLANAYVLQGNQKSAAEVMQTMAEVAPDSLFHLYQYQQLLIALRDFDKEAQIGILIDRVERAYRPR